MASAYELMLVLRGRSYLTNDLRRAGADMARLRTMGQLTATRSQLGINAQRLATTRSIAQAELASITNGQRATSLAKATHSYHLADLTATKNLEVANAAITTSQAEQAKNAEKLVALQKEAQMIVPGSANMMQNQAAQRELIAMNKALSESEVQLNYQLARAQENMVRVNLEEQRLAEATAAMEQRQSVLTDRINTTNAALELNTQKLNENALAMQRLPLEQLAGRARYVEHLGRAFQTLGLFITAALGYAAYSAAKFNTEITLAATQSTLTTNNTAKQVLANATVLQNSVQRMLTAGKTAFKPSDLGTSLYTIFSGLSLKGGQAQQLKEGTQILQEFNKVATANYGQVQLNDVTKMGIALINNFKLSVQQLDPVLQRMQAGVRFGAMTMGEMTSSLNQVIPAFKAAGYSASQMFADIAFVSRVFPSLRIGTTGLARLTETFGKYHDEISKDVGRNIAPGGQLLPINQIVEAIVKAHPALAKGGVDLQNYFKTVTGASQFVNARRVFVQYATQVGLYHDVAGKVINDNNELTKSFRDMSQTPQVRWAEFTNQLRGIVMEIGSGAIPVFQKIAGPIKSAIDWFNKLSPANRKLVGEFATWIGVGALVGGTLLVITGAFARLYATIRLFTIGRAVSSIAKDLSAAKTIASGGASLGEAGFISARAGLGLGIAAAIPLMIMYHKQVGDIINSLGGLKNVITLVTAAFAAFKFIQFSLLIVRLAGLLAQVETVNGAVMLLRANLLGIGGLVVTATVLIIERKKIEGAIKTALGDKGVESAIDPYTGKPRSISFGQRASQFLFAYSPVLPWQNPANTIGQQRNALSQYYQDFLKTTNQMGSPKALQQFEGFMKEFGITVNSKVITPLKDVQASLYAFLHPSGMGIVTGLLKNIVNNEKDAVTWTKAMRLQFEHGIGSMSAGVNIMNAAAARKNINQFELMMRQIDRIVALHGKAETTGLAQDYLAYFSLLDATTKKYSGAMLDTFNQLLSKADKSATATATNTATSLQDIASNVLSMYDSLYQQNQSIMGTLFQGPFISGPLQQNRAQWGGKFGGMDYLKDIKSQVFQFKEFYNYIGRLQRRGAPQELIQQIIQAGPQALPAIRALTNMAPRQWQEYISVFNRGQQLLHNQTITQLKSQLADYRKYGNNIAQQIIAGMRDKRVGLTNEIKNIIQGMFGVTTPTTHRPGHTRLAPATHHTTHITNNTTYHVTAPHGASVATQVKHADFARRNKHDTLKP